MRPFAILAMTALCSGPISAPAFAQVANEPVSIDQSGSVDEAAPANAAPPSNEPAPSFAPRIRGHWLLFVDTGPMNLNVQPVSASCGSYAFPLQLSESFAVALSNALKNAFERIDDVAAPIAGEALRRHGATGMIVVRGQELRPRLDVQTKFFSANMQTQVVMMASVQADSHRGQLLNGNIRGEGIANVSEGLLCDGGSGRKSVTEAGALAVGDTVSKIVDALSSSQRVIASYVPPPPPKPVRRTAPNNRTTDASRSPWPSTTGTGR